ncbi:MAG TPA: hypothetical protein DCP02_07165 [Actinobacteria bacterium]|nr:hypothetical protein [Actinomycetota bacterium]
MSKSNKNIKEDEMWCPECGAPIKKGFFTCSNCKLKVRFTEEINKKQDRATDKRPTDNSKRKAKKDDAASNNIVETMPELLDNVFNTKDSSKNKDGHPGWWIY